MPVVEEKVNGNLKIVQYQESPIMSTYLVAVVVGLFDYVEDHTSDGKPLKYLTYVLLLCNLSFVWQSTPIIMQELKSVYTAKLERHIKGSLLYMLLLKHLACIKSMF